MNLRNPTAHVFIPDGASEDVALARTTHMGIGAHPDDLEILAIHGIGTCLNEKDLWFTGVTVTDGAPVGDPIEGYLEMRQHEQIAAAKKGKYGAQFQLGYNSDEISGTQPVKYQDALADLVAIIRRTKPKTVYLHNIFDKHETHGAVSRLALDAFRQVRDEHKPEQLYGVEIWGSLDWAPWDMKIALDVTDYMALQKKLLAYHVSQHVDQYQYSEAAPARALANAVFGENFNYSTARATTLVIDMMPFINEPDLSVMEFTERYLYGLDYWMKQRAKQYEFPPKS